MIKSMTGFASLTREDDAATIAVSVKTVNHRFLDVQVRAPQALADIEPRVRQWVQPQVAQNDLRASMIACSRLKYSPRYCLSLAMWWQPLACTAWEPSAWGRLSTK